MMSEPLFCNVTTMTQHAYTPAGLSKGYVINQILSWWRIVPHYFLCCQVVIPHSTIFNSAAAVTAAWLHHIKGLHSSWMR